MEVPPLKVYSMTDIGKKRELNEDYIYTSVLPIGGLSNLFIVADGMGGHNAGDYASAHAVKTFVETAEKSTQGEKTEDILRSALEKANTFVHKTSLSDTKLSGMGTTMVVATCKEDKVTIANVGDSRLYVINDTITQITKDHSLVEEMVSLGGIDKEAARNHPDKNIITRAVGVKPSVEIDFFELTVTKADRLLLCSDGLTNMLRDEEICEIVQKYEEIELAARALIDAANYNGGRDNIAVILVEPLGGHA